MDRQNTKDKSKQGKPDLDILLPQEPQSPLRLHRQLFHQSSTDTSLDLDLNMARNNSDRHFSFRDLPKFEDVKGEHPNTHLMEFEDYLQASNIPTIPGRDGHGAEVIPVDYKSIINKFKASLKNKARL